MRRLQQFLSSHHVLACQTAVILGYLIMVYPHETRACQNSSDCGGGQVCDPATGECVECLHDGDCDDGRFCNGAETCVAGACQAGTPPCIAGQVCDEADDACREGGCEVDADCYDGNLCTIDTCDTGVCQNTPVECPEGQVCDSTTGECRVDCWPKAVFEYDPKPMAGGNIRFDASSSSPCDMNGEITQYTWYWGDGSPTEIVYVPQCTHVYQLPGIYDVTLYVLDTHSRTDSTSRELDLSLDKGDLLFCRDDGSVVPGREWTHVGIYLGGGEIVEALNGPGVVVTPFSAWSWPEKTYVRAMRVNAPLSTRNNAADFAEGQQGQPYDVNSIALQALRFQDKDETPGWYCSELVWAAYWYASNLTVDLDQKWWINGNAVTPDEIASGSTVVTLGEHKEEKPETNWCWDRRLWGGVAYCPVDLIVLSPEGLVLSKEQNEIAGAIYAEIDVNQDGEPDDFYAIPNPTVGDYLIYIAAEPDASGDEEYSLKVVIDSEASMLAENVPVSEIPADPYVVRVSVRPDLDRDNDVDQADFNTFDACFSGPAVPLNPGCENRDFDNDGDVDQSDFAILQRCFSGENNLADPNCAN